MRLQKTAYRVVTQFVLNKKHYMVNQIKENESVRACSINGADKIYIKYLSKKLKRRDPLQDLSIGKNYYNRL
jgi:hypothetical protein